MRARHPDRWLMTDERQGEALWRALERLPRGGGIVFRHHATPTPERARLFARVAAVARRRGLVLVRAGAPRFRGERGRHGRRGPGLVTWPAHTRREAVAAVRAGATLVQGYTGFVYGGPLWARRINRELAAAVRGAGATTIQELVGDEVGVRPGVAHGAPAPDGARG